MLQLKYNLTLEDKETDKKLKKLKNKKNLKKLLLRFNQVSEGLKIGNW